MKEKRKQNKETIPHIFIFPDERKKENYVCFYIREVVYVNSNKNDYKKNLI